ncbi:MAG TPA: aldo/keto reductase [Phycisphaerales bacterium]|nr:aldo/keto reductase [Phycisphaerales bacterium]
MDGGAKPAAAPGAGRIELPMREFGRTGMKVRVLGLGTLQIGIEHADQDTATKVLNTALDEGCNVIDTAECYMKAETLIGNAVAHRRKDYFLFTKVGHVLNDDETTQWAPEWDEPGILKSVDRSLRRLKTDHLDLVHLHSCGPRILERGEAIGALEKAKQAGKVRFLGYSGDHRPALWALDSGKFDSLMTSLSVADQESIDMLLPVAREKKIGVIIKRPIANAAWRHESADPSEYHYEYWRRLRELKYDFLQGETRDKPGPEGGAGVAMRFTLAHPIDLMIVGSSNPARFRQNAEIVAAGPLPAAQVNEIRARWKQVAQPNWFGQI